MESKLRQARLAHNMTVAALAKKIGVGHTAVTNYEMGYSRPTPKVFSKLQKILDLQGSIDELFPQKEKPVRRRKYRGIACKRPGCTRQAEANYLCMTHAVAAWKKRKKRQDELILQSTMEELIELKKSGNCVEKRE